MIDTPRIGYLAEFTQNLTGRRPGLSLARRIGLR
jgi:hypothetical protein